MDIGSKSTKDVSETVLPLILLDPMTGEELEHEGTKMIAWTKNKNSKAYSNSASRTINAAEAAKKRGNDDFDLASETIKGANVLASTTVRLRFYADGKWHDYKSEDGEKSVKGIKEAYLEYDWIAEQVRVARDKVSLFWGLSKPNLPNGSSNDAGTEAHDQIQNSQD